MPHMRLNFVPINNGRLSSKSLFDRQKLSQLQTELWEQVGKKYGLKRGKSGSAAMHVSAAEHRAKTIIKEAEERGADIDEQPEKKIAELAGLTQAIDAVTEATNQPLPKKKKEVEREIKTLRVANAAYNVYTIETTFKRLFPNHHPHELRYMFITRAKESGVSCEAVMLWAGHSFDKKVNYSLSYQRRIRPKLAVVAGFGPTNDGVRVRHSPPKTSKKGAKLPQKQPFLMIF